MTEQQKYKCEPNLWVSNYADHLFNFAISRVSDTGFAEDLVQDTFVSALKNLKNFRGDCTEKSWLFGILRNKIIDHYRAKSRKSISDNIEGDDTNSMNRFFYQQGKHAGHWIEDNAPQPFHEPADASLQHQEFLSILEKCIDLLPTNWAEVFKMKTLEELNSKEICKELNISSSNLWVIVHRAKLQMRECIEKKWL